MKRNEWLLALGVTMTMASFAAHGCSTEATGDGDDDSDASSSSGGSSSSSSSGAISSSSSSGSSASSGGSSGGDASACYTPEKAVGWSSQNQTAGSGECNGAQIDALWAACTGEGATDQACKDVRDGLGACGGCLTGSGDPATRKSGFVTFKQGAAVAFNTLCEANAVGEEAECGSKEDNFFQCLRGGCIGCYADGNEAAYRECALVASEGPCAPYVPTKDCEAVLEDPDNAAAIAEKCGNLQGGNIAKADFEKAALYLCGPAQ